MCPDIRCHTATQEALYPAVPWTKREQVMERQQIGVVQDLFRYPVKSMLGERLSAVEIGTQGVIGDRAYALREVSGRVVTAKKWSNMLEVSACYDAPPPPGALAPLR